MLHTCVASTDRDYTTTSALKAMVLGATATSTVEDAAFSDMIRRASRWADTYVGYNLGLSSYLETVASFGSRNLMLARTPLRSVRRLFPSTDTGDGGTQLATSEYRVEDREAGFISRDQGWAWTAPLQHELEARPLPGQEYKPWLVDYVAGYTYGGLTTDSPHWSTEHGSTSTGRTLPEDIEQAVLLRASSFHAGNEDVESEALGDLRINYRTEGEDRESQASYEIMLDPYRRMA